MRGGVIFTFPSKRATSMPEFELRLIVFLICVGAFTVTASVSDIRARKIPNKLTLPMLIAGLVYRIAFFDPSGFGDGLLAFLIGFGTLFILWMVGGGGGGDVKLMGALSVWLGVRMTIYVLLGSTITVIVGTILVMGWSVLTRGIKRTKKQYMATGKDDGKSKREKQKKETVAQRQERRVMAYAVPVGIATWVVILAKLGEYPWLS